MAQILPSDVVAAIRILVSSFAVQHDPGTKQDFEQILTARVEAFKATLAEEKRFEKLHEYLQAPELETSEEFAWNWKDFFTQKTTINTEHASDGDSKWEIRWKYTKICLQMLKVLTNIMQGLAKMWRENPSLVDKSGHPSEKSKKGPDAPKLGPDALSVSDQKVVLACVQFIVSLGLCPNLFPGVGIPVEKRSEFGEFIKLPDGVISEKHLFKCVWTLLECTKHPTLGSIILSRHLGDLLAGLMQLCFASPSFYDKYDRILNPKGENSTENSSDLSNTKSTVDDNSEIESQKLSEKTSLSAMKAGEPAKTSDGNNSENVYQKVLSEWDNFLSTKSDNYKANFITASQRELCWSELQRLLERVYQPMIVRELLMLQSGGGGGSKRQPPAQGNGIDSTGIKKTCTSEVPKGAARPKGTIGSRDPSCLSRRRWFTTLCGRLLSECLMKPNGVQAVLRGILEVPGDPSSAPDWRKCDMVAKLVANSPSQVQSVDEYYAHVGPQVLGLLHLSSAGLGRQFIRVAASTIQLMIKLHPGITRKHVLDVLLIPLLRTTNNQAPGPSSSQIVADETSLTRCVEDIHKVFIGSEPVDTALLHLSGVVYPLFEMFCFTRKGISHLRSSCLEILAKFLKHTDSTTALKTLYILAFKSKPPKNFGDTLNIKDNSGQMTLDNNLKKDDFTKSTSQGMFKESVHIVVGGKETNIASSKETNTGIPNQESTAQINLSKDASLHNEVSESKIMDNEMLIPLMSSGYVFAHGDSGGVVIKWKGGSSSSCAESSDDVLRGLCGDMMMDYEVRALCLVELLDGLGRDGLAGEFFLHLMQELTGIISGQDEDIQSTPEEDLLSYDRSASKQQHSLLIFHLLALMCDKLGPAILKNTYHMLTFIQSTLERGCLLSQEGQEEAGLIPETLTMAMGMLSAILGGAVKLEPHERAFVKEFMPLLEMLSLQNPDTELGAMATDLRIAIATHGAIWSQQLKDAAGKLGKHATNGNVDTGNKDEEDPIPESAAYDEAFGELCDPLVPVRGHAMMALASLLNNRDPKALKQVDTLLKVFEEQLAHDDSYIYLAAVQGLVALAGIKPDPVLPHLARQFALCRNETGNVEKGNEKGHYNPKAGASRPSATIPQRSPELRMKLGEALIRATRACGPLLPRYSQHLLAALLTGARDPEPMVRASSLSNLGEVCKLLRFSLGPITHEILSCLSAVLNTDKSEHVRRAAVLVITLLLRGLGKDSIQVLSSSLREIYHLLKVVEAADADETTRLHAQVALGELDTIMREFLFPKPTFTKRIQVLP